MLQLCVCYCDNGIVNFMLKMLQGLYLRVLRQFFLVGNCISSLCFSCAALNVSIYFDRILWNAFSSEAF